MPRLKIYAAPTEDVNQGWIRLGDCGLPHRSIIKLSASTTSKHVYCEVLTIDENFINAYNENPKHIKITEPQSALVASEWYRKKLGDLKTRTESEIDVTPVNCFCGQICACLDHPQVVVRLATILGLVGCILGLVAVALAIIPLFK
jgi:hypothetical protein